MPQDDKFYGEHPSLTPFLDGSREDVFVFLIGILSGE